MYDGGVQMKGTGDIGRHVSHSERLGYVAMAYRRHYAELARNSIFLEYYSMQPASRAHWAFDPGTVDDTFYE